MAKKKMKRVVLRISVPENLFVFVKNSAEVYAEGNVAEWARYCLRNYQPKYLEIKRKKRGPNRTPSQQKDKLQKDETILEF